MRGKWIPAICGTVVAGLLLLTAGSAAAGPASRVQISVSPSRVEIPTTRHSVVFRVNSGSSQAVHVISAVYAMRQDTQGDMLVAPGVPAQYGAAWLSVTPAAFVLRPGQTQDVRVGVVVPPHQAGQRYLAVVFSVAAATNALHAKAGAAVSAGVAGTLIIDVPGTAHRDPAVTLSAPGLSLGGPVPLTLTVSNQRSNTYVLFNKLTTTRDGQTVARWPGMLVLAGSRRIVTQQWANPPLLCIACTLRGPDGATVTVTILPLYQAGGGLLLLLGLILLVFFGRRSIRRKINREVERKLGEQRDEGQATT
jgi:P pilus assembly chaperone PapD